MCSYEKKSRTKQWYGLQPLSIKLHKVNWHFHEEQSQWLRWFLGYSTWYNFFKSPPFTIKWLRIKIMLHHQSNNITLNWFFKRTKNTPIYLFYRSVSNSVKSLFYLFGENHQPKNTKNTKIYMVRKIAYFHRWWHGEISL